MLSYSSKNNFNSKQLGFTMIELMVTVVIIGILTAAALPSFREFIVNQRIKNAAFDFAVSLRQARGEAIKRNLPIRIAAPSNNYTNGWTIRENPVGPIIYEQSAYPQVTFRCLTGGGYVCDPVVYGTDGRLYLGTFFLNGQVEVSSNTISNPQKRCITIDLSGLPNSKKGAC